MLDSIQIDILNLHPVFRMDSYKGSHFLMYPPNMTAMRSYIEARGGEYAETVFFGLQALIKSHMMRPITMSDILLAEDVFALHGVPFNKAGWLYILDKFGGHLPLSIEAAPEGTIMGVKNVQLQVINLGGEATSWLTSYVETSLLRGVWYASTVSTISRKMKQYIWQGLEQSADDPAAEIDFKLHDFGGRGAAAGESAMLGGMGHLVNFKGTDTFEAIMGAREFYHEPMAGFSIPASEHSVVTAWGRDGESDMVGHLLKNFPEGMVANVADTYDIFNHVRNILGKDHKATIMARDGVYIIRPDSGNPLKMPLDVIEIAFEVFGHTVNSKGFRVLPPQVRVIQGDGMSEKSIPRLLQNAIDRGISVSNFAMGMGGGLLQKLDRDTLKYAMKANEATFADGEVRAIYKDPITDPGKTSKKGRQALIQYNGEYTTVPYANIPQGGHGQARNYLQPVWNTGELLVDDTFSAIRDRAAIAM